MGLFLVELVDGSCASFEWVVFDASLKWDFFFYLGGRSVHSGPGGGASFYSQWRLAVWDLSRLSVHNSRSHHNRTLILIALGLPNILMLRNPLRWHAPWFNPQTTTWLCLLLLLLVSLRRRSGRVRRTWLSMMLLLSLCRRSSGVRRTIPRFDS